MPYIPEHDRKDYTDILNELKSKLHNVGELNFFITSVVHTFLKQKGASYKTFNDIIGVLECAKLEMYRRRVSPYEDKKIDENGDVGFDEKLSS